MFGTNKKRRGTVAAAAFLIVGLGASSASAHADGSRGEGRSGSRVPLTATQEACLTAQGHVHPSRSTPHVKDAAHKATNDAAYAACGITRTSKATTTSAA